MIQKYTNEKYFQVQFLFIQILFKIFRELNWIQSWSQYHKSSQIKAGVYHYNQRCFDKYDINIIYAITNLSTCFWCNAGSPCQKKN